VRHLGPRQVLFQAGEIGVGKANRRADHRQGQPQADRDALQKLRVLAELVSGDIQRDDTLVSFSR
jgi:hypothetical protein